MKNLTLFIGYFVVALFLQPIKAQQCSVATSIATLDANAVTATIPHAGDFFWDGTNPGYAVEDGTLGDEVHSIFAGGLWVGGFGGSDLKQATSTYGMATGKTDYWPGPLSEVVGVIDSETCTNWDRHWKIMKTDIDAFITDWSDGGVSVDDIPPSVAGWPARGNALFFDINGFELPNTSQEFAPFHDLTADGIYDPTEGDYPLIKGDQAIYWVFNDAGDEHTESDGAPIRMEFHAMAYAYASDNENINNTTFYDLTFINKGISPLDSAYVGLWLDFDFGCFTDDYFGSIPEKDMAFVYNQDEFDGATGCSCPDGVNTFCEEIPMMGIKMLKGVKAGRVYNADGGLEVPAFNETPDVFVDLGLTSLTYYNSEALTPSPTPGTGAPTTIGEYYNLLSGRWTDGTPMTNSGNGYNSGGEITTYAFSGNPSEPGEWSMCSQNLPSQDSRILLGSGPFNLESGGTNSISFSIFHVKDVVYPCPSTANLTQACEDISNLYNSISPVETLNQSLSVSVNPNPFSNETLLQLKNSDASIEQLDLYNVSGRLVRSYDELLSNTIVIERKNLTTGMYFYKLVTSKQQYVSGKLFVQ